MNYEITPLDRGFIVRPAGCLGTCGWINGAHISAARWFKREADARRFVRQQERLK